MAAPDPLPRAVAAAVGSSDEVTRSSLDPESAAWLAALERDGEPDEAAIARLHGLLLRVSLREVRRRSGQLRVAGPELDDLANQAAADAVMVILAKLGQVRGESRFTTWAYKFAIFEVSTKMGRHFWQKRAVSLEADDWDRLPDRLGVDPAQQAESADLVAAVRRVVATDLTPRQRQVFVVIVVRAFPLTYWWSSSVRAAMPSTRRCSMPDVSSEPVSSPTATCSETS